MYIIIAVLGLIITGGIIFDKAISTGQVTTLIAFYFLIVPLLFWLILSIRYTFYDSYLLVKGGPFRSKIYYTEVTEVNRTKDLYTGYRILSSTDAIEIHYRSSAFGSVKISPSQQEEFIQELIKRCPHIKVNLE